MISILSGWIRIIRKKKKFYFVYFDLSLIAKYVKWWIMIHRSYFDVIITKYEVNEHRLMIFCFFLKYVGMYFQLKACQNELDIFFDINNNMLFIQAKKIHTCQRRNILFFLTIQWHRPYWNVSRIRRKILREIISIDQFDVKNSEYFMKKSYIKSWIVKLTLLVCIRYRISYFSVIFRFRCTRLMKYHWMKYSQLTHQKLDNQQAWCLADAW